jgi:hypothetical protein
MVAATADRPADQSGHGVVVMATDAQCQLIRILLRQRGLYESEAGRGLRAHMRRRTLSLVDASRAIDLLKS